MLTFLGSVSPSLSPRSTISLSRISVPSLAIQPSPDISIATYTSSKATLTNPRDSLRLELFSPFGASVMAIMAGIVELEFLQQRHRG
ncbi:hypothetical protein K445DRAFT_313431 [Daldinia sp. EC12]|nr:hypothetical protein K445DRAFT_313431 [Daldinia sp. EC12]